MATQLIGIRVESAAPTELAGFWAEALGWHADGTTVRSGVPGVPDLLFTASQRPKTAKNRLHLDLDHAPDGDVDTEAARLMVLGAQHTDIGQGTVPWRVLADPEGNEFCVLPRPPLPHAGPPRESGVGRLAQICLDAADMNRQETFWAAATGWTFAVRDAWAIRLSDREDTAPTLVMGPPAAPKAGANRLGLVLSAADGPIEDSVRGLVASGATLAGDADTATGADAEPGTALVDPEGNEFWVTHAGNAPR